MKLQELHSPWAYSESMLVCLSRERAILTRCSIHGFATSSHATDWLSWPLAVMACIRRCYLTHYATLQGCRLSMVPFLLVLSRHTVFANRLRLPCLNWFHFSLITRS